MVFIFFSLPWSCCCLAGRHFSLSSVLGCPYLCCTGGASGEQESKVLRAVPTADSFVQCRPAFLHSAPVGVSVVTAKQGGKGAVHRAALSLSDAPSYIVLTSSPATLLHSVIKNKVNRGNLWGKKRKRSPVFLDTERTMS